MGKVVYYLNDVLHLQTFSLHLQTEASWQSFGVSSGMKKKRWGWTEEFSRLAAHFLWACHDWDASEQGRKKKVAAYNFSTASLIYWACHARVASEQEEVMERYAVDCQAGAFENKFGDGKETSGGSHEDVTGKVEGYREELTLGKEISPLPRCSTLVVCAKM